MSYAKAREELIRQIVALELDMFVNVKSVEPAACQQMPRTFKAMRSMSHSAWSIETLSSYLHDLQIAAQAGRNLITEKYARMDNLIPPINQNPVIQCIVDVEGGWIRELHEKYPLSVKYDERFEIYALAELETYSDSTLALYWRDVECARQAGINLAEIRYEHLYMGLGYHSLEEVEQRAQTANR